MSMSLGIVRNLHSNSLKFDRLKQLKVGICDHFLANSYRLDDKLFLNKQVLSNYPKQLWKVVLKQCYEYLQIVL